MTSERRTPKALLIDMKQSVAERAEEPFLKFFEHPLPALTPPYEPKGK